MQVGGSNSLPSADKGEAQDAGVADRACPSAAPGLAGSPRGCRQRVTGSASGSSLVRPNRCRDRPSRSADRRRRLGTALPRTPAGPLEQLLQFADLHPDSVEGPPELEQLLEHYERGGPIVLSSRRMARRHDQRVYDGDMGPSDDSAPSFPTSHVANALASQAARPCLHRITRSRRRADRPSSRSP